MELSRRRQQQQQPHHQQQQQQQHSGGEPVHAGFNLPLQQQLVCLALSRPSLSLYQSSVVVTSDYTLISTMSH